MLHSLFVAIVFINFEYNESDNGNSEVTASGNKNSGDTERQIIEVSLSSGTDEKTVSKDFYYGIGVSINKTLYNGRYAYDIIEVFDGYPAAAAGLMKGDIIIELNGKQMSRDKDDDIVSNKPRLIMLTIKHADRIFTISVTTDKIYLKK